MTDRPIIFSAAMIRDLLDGRKVQDRRILKPQPPAPPPANCHPFHQPRHATPYLDAYCGERRTEQNPRGMSRDWHWWQVDDRPGHIACRAPCVPGDRLWVKETHSVWADAESARAAQCIEGSDDPCIYRADFKDGTDSVAIGGTGWRSPVTMPRWASRLTLIVTDARVQRVQDITEADAQAEGLQPYKFPGPWWQGYRDDGDGDLVQQQYVGETPPDWMIEPRRMKDASHLDRSAVHLFTTLWNSLHGPDAWDANPWVAALTFTTHRQNIDQMEMTHD